MYDNLDNVKAGDSVLVHAPYNSGTYMSVITRVTPTQLEIGNSKFRKKDGRQVGGPTYGSTSLSADTPENREKYATSIEKNKRIRLVGRLGNLQWSKFSTSALESISAFVKALEVQLAKESQGQPTKN